MDTGQGSCLQAEDRGFPRVQASESLVPRMWFPECGLKTRSAGNTGSWLEMQKLRSLLVRAWDLRLLQG